MTNKKILVVDDDEFGRELINDIFANSDYLLDFAVDGLDAVNKYRAGGYDLILMDIRMPNKDGIEATTEIRFLEKDKKKIPIIALTASIVEEEKKKCFDAGMNDFIIKPIRVDDLRLKVKKYLE